MGRSGARLGIWALAAALFVLWVDCCLGSDVSSVRWARDSQPVLTSSNGERDQQKLALSSLYYNTGGPTWHNNTHWNQGDFCLWYGIECTQGLVSVISLASNNLTGTLPPTLGNVTTLYLLDVSLNHLEGTVPDTIDQLAGLTYLYLQQNFKLSGSLPPGLGNLERLVHLDVSFNNLTSAIPYELSNCTSLRVFMAQENFLSGTIPSPLGQLHNLQMLNLDSNKLTGRLPSALGSMVSLKVLILSGNLFSGSLPSELGRLRNLIHLDLSYNRLADTLPTTLFQLPELAELQLTSNGISGTLPSDISALMQLTRLELSLNQLEGTIPRLAMAKLVQLDLSTNQFSGSLPDLSGLPSVQFLDVSSNQLSGTIPQTVPGLKQMIDFDASANELSGTLPAWTANISFSVYLLDNGFLCPYPSDLPKNIHVNSECVSGLWYQGIFMLLVVLLEMVGFVLVATAVTLCITFGLSRPALITRLFAEGKTIDVAALQRRSVALQRTKSMLLGTCVLEFLVSALLIVLGVVMDLTQENQQLYSVVFLASIPVMGVLFTLKTCCVAYFALYKHQKWLLLCTCGQVIQLVFVWWTQTLAGVEQANVLCLVTLVLIVLDTMVDLCAALEAYYVQDKFVPVSLLQMDDKLKDAEGVFGEVRHGKYLGQDVAVKRSKPETKKERQEIYKAFLNEARVLGELGHHPNIVKLVGISPMLEDEFYIVMEYCESGSALSFLTRLRQRETMEVWLDAVVKLCRETCDAMHYMHERGYTHRDITASNIFVKGGRAMLGDLGLARPMENERGGRKGRCGEGEVASYMPSHHSLYAPPELLDPAMGGQYTRGCDVYCFGIAVWEMLVLRSWSREDAVRGQAAALQQLHELPPFFVNVISRCWHDEDQFRPSFAELLEVFVRHSREKWATYRKAAPRPLSGCLPDLSSPTLAQSI